MQVGDLVRAKLASKVSLNFPTTFGIVTKIHHTGNLAFVQWIDDRHYGARPINFCYLEVICK